MNNFDIHYDVPGEGSCRILDQTREEVFAWLDENCFRGFYTNIRIEPANRSSWDPESFYADFGKDR